MCKVKNCCDCLFLKLGDMVSKCRHPKGKAIQMDPFLIEGKGKDERHPECPKMIEFLSLEEFLLLGDYYGGRIRTFSGIYPNNNFLMFRLEKKNSDRCSIVFAS